MAVRFQLESGEVLEFNETSLTLGSSPSCHIALTDDDRVGEIHATIRKMGNRWLLETAKSLLVSVDNSVPAQRHWLQTAGQVIWLTPTGPRIVFQPAVSQPTVSPAVESADKPVRETPVPVAEVIKGSKPAPSSPSAVPYVVEPLDEAQYAVDDGGALNLDDESEYECIEPPSVLNPTSSRPPASSRHSASASAMSADSELVPVDEDAASDPTPLRTGAQTAEAQAAREAWLAWQSQKGKPAPPSMEVQRAAARNAESLYTADSSQYSATPASTGSLGLKVGILIAILAVVGLVGYVSWPMIWPKQASVVEKTKREPKTTKSEPTESETSESGAAASDTNEADTNEADRAKPDAAKPEAAKAEAKE